jgi:DNA-binding HxlR family transcriptional regulator
MQRIFIKDSSVVIRVVRRCETFKQITDALRALLGPVSDRTVHRHLAQLAQDGVVQRTGACGHYNYSVTG